MRLVRFGIPRGNRFRGLDGGFEVRFLREIDGEAGDGFHPYALVGPNGSGKSNLLEALASVFYHLECVNLAYRPEDFEYDAETNPRGFRPELSDPDAYELEYRIETPEGWMGKTERREVAILVRKVESSAPAFFWRELEEDGESYRPLAGRAEMRQVLPDFVVGYSSGENEILSLPFLKMRFIHFDEYLDYLFRQTGYPGVPEGRLAFLGPDYDQALLLSAYLMLDDERLGPIRDAVGFLGIRCFRMILKRELRFSEFEAPYDIEDSVRNQILRTEEDESGATEEYLKILETIQGTIGKFRKCATCRYADEENREEYLDFFANAATRKAFRLHFDSPIELFQAFRLLLALNLYPAGRRLKAELYASSSLYANETVPVLASDRRVFRFKDFWILKREAQDPILVKALSDGEHQLVHTLGLCVLFRDSQCLFLLDEPETHFNPDWRAKYITRVRDCFQERKAVSDLLITTHTPYIVSDSRSESVLVFGKDESGRVRVERPEYVTFGASVGRITRETFATKRTIGAYANGVLEDLKKRSDGGEPKEAILKEIDDRLGESVEKTLFLHSLLESGDES